MSGWPLVRLSEVLTQSIDRHPVEAGKCYPNIGIYGFGRGVFEKPPIDGGAFAADSLYRVSAGQFIYSRLKAFEGAYGLVPDFGDGSYVTNEFPAFDMDSHALLPAFLYWYFKCPSTWEQLARHSTGIGARRERLHPNAFLSELIALPPLKEQERIVREIEDITTRLDEARRLRKEIQDDAKALLHSVFHRLIQGAAYCPLAEVAPIVR
ncbi:MAG: restriction endonuclease subunit S, partial [Lamprocystis purpurea]|nr:restriction endonuclease subunit S [Lamprocystis purpurea]